MSLNTRLTRNLFVCLALPALLIVIYFAVRQPGIPSERQYSEIVTNNARVPTSSAAAPKSESEMKNRKALGISLPEAGKSASSSSLDAVAKRNAEESFKPVLRKFEQVESANMKQIHSHETPEYQFIALAVTAPSQEQIDALYAEASAYIRGGDAKETPYREELALQALDDFLNYPKPVKVLLVSLNFEKGGWVTEGFFPNMTEAQPSKEGLLPFPPDSGMRTDKHLGAKSTWARKRYSHLLDLGPETP